MSSACTRGSLSRFEGLSGSICTTESVRLTALSFIQPCTNGEGHLSHKPINSDEQLRIHFTDKCFNQDRDMVIVVHQNYSWSRLQITNSALQDLARHLSVFAGFWDIVRAYGVKTHHSEREFYGWRSIATRSQDKATKYEQCYNLPFMDKHGRELPDPWSLRQTGVYRQFYSNKKASQWIMLSLRDNARADLEHVLKSKEDCCRLSTHVELLSILERNWPEYIEYLSTELRGLDNKACYTTIDDSEKGGFTVSYESLQEAHMLQAKIEQAKVTISSCIDIAMGCHSSFASRKEKFECTSLACHECLSLLRTYKKVMTERLESVKRLDCTLRDISTLLSRILTCRNEILITNSNQASQKSLTDLVAFTTQSEKQQFSLTQILSVVQAESVLLKALSTMAIVCLPLSLMAIVFFSSFIQAIHCSKTGSGSSWPSLAPHFGICIILSLPAMFVTLTLTLYLNQRMYNKISIIAARVADHPHPAAGIESSSWMPMLSNGGALHSINEKSSV